MSIAPPLHKAVKKNQKATPPPVPEKPKGPAYTPPKPRPLLVKVENPRRLRKGSKEY